MNRSLNSGGPRQTLALLAIEHALKFTIVGIGGNCTALSRDFGEWKVQITADADGDAPTTDDEPVTIYLHSPRGTAGQRKCKNAVHAHAWLVRFIAFVEDRRGDPHQFEWESPEG